ncbi:uncharacterized protein [Littorina saxatilis]|uniref:uncharacterized protein isoform X2 n=1 Tax=Littorina saxatilis TaxID=31220 RepID=UPI0038B4C28C
MEAKSVFAFLCVLFVSGAHGQNSCLTDNRYVSVDKSCCTVMTVINVAGGCCFTVDGQGCRCDPTKSSCGSQQPTAAPTAAPTIPATAAPTAAQTARTLDTTISPGTPMLCPAVPRGRLLNAQRVTDVCAHNGVIGFSVVTNGVKRQFCNAVVVYNSYTNTREIVMSQDCRIGITQVVDLNFQFFATSQDVEFPFSLCNIAYEFPSDQKTVMIPDMVLSGFLDSLVSNCDNTACGFNSVVMGSEVRLETNCYLLSYGATGMNVASPGDYTSNGLRRARVVTTSYLNCGLTVSRGDELCLRVEDNAGICQGDTSAALFCPLTTGEDVFLGFVSTTTVCTGAVPSYAPVKIHVISATG